MTEPLASRLRPVALEDFIGQAHLVAPGRPLAQAIAARHRFSFILWGPPGVGKTTLAKIYAAALDAEFYELSAVAAGKDDIRRIVAAPSTRPKLLFLDEIHRFSKAQQDFLLPFVERGELTLVGATTENPSFEVIAALLSRCRVFVLESLTAAEIGRIVDRAGVRLSAPARDTLAAVANGDARQALTILENTRTLYQKVTPATIAQTLQRGALRHDRKGEEHYNLASALIKSLRASQPDAALYYLARLIAAGEDPKFIARRLVIFASEDIGLALPTALVVADAAFQAVTTIGLPECGINLAHAVAYLARAPKDRSAYTAYQAALTDVEQHGNLAIPLVLRNAPTALLKELGYGAGYEPYTTDDLLPATLKGRRYLAPPKR